MIIGGKSQRCFKHTLRIMDFDKFQQFQPKSLKKVLEESNQQQITRMKEFAEEYEGYIQEKLRERMQYLQENHSDTHTVRR